MRLTGENVLCGRPHETPEDGKADLMMDWEDLAKGMRESIDDYLAKILAMAVDDGLITSDQRSRILSADYGSRPEPRPVGDSSGQPEKASSKRHGGITS
jgi:hypothetical protein